MYKMTGIIQKKFQYASDRDSERAKRKRKRLFPPSKCSASVNGTTTPQPQHQPPEEATHHDHTNKLCSTPQQQIQPASNGYPLQPHIRPQTRQEVVSARM